MCARAEIRSPATSECLIVRRAMARAAFILLCSISIQASAGSFYDTVRLLADENSGVNGFSDEDLDLTELKKRQAEDLAKYQNLSSSEKLKLGENRTDPSLREEWLYEHWGRAVGFWTGIFVVFVHHIAGIVFAVVVKRRRARRYKGNVGSLAAPKKFSRHYEQICITKSTMILGSTDTLNARASALENEELELLEVSSPAIPLPFDQYGVEGPNGERIVDRNEPIREPLPGEKPPLIMDMENMPASLMNNAGFLDMQKLVEQKVVIVRTTKLRNGYLKGYLGGRIPTKRKGNTADGVLLQPLAKNPAQGLI